MNENFEQYIDTFSENLLNSMRRNNSDCKKIYVIKHYNTFDLREEDVAHRAATSPNVYYHNFAGSEMTDAFEPFLGIIKDMYTKYISQGRQYLHMLHGNNKDHLKRWLYNRFQYVDSLFLQHNSPYTKQNITIRSCAPADAVPKRDEEGNIISPYTARFEIQTYSPQYVTVCWRKNTFETKRIDWGETVVFENDMVNSQDNELIIYCATNLKHLGDCSGLNPTSIDIGAANRLVEFKCEHSDKLVKADISKNNYLNKVSTNESVNYEQVKKMLEARLANSYFVSTEIASSILK